MAGRTRFHALLAAKLEEVLDGYKEELSTGSAQDYEQYKFYVGYCAAIRDVLKTCDQVEEDLDK